MILICGANICYIPKHQPLPSLTYIFLAKKNIKGDNFFVPIISSFCTKIG